MEGTDLDAVFNCFYEEPHLTMISGTKDHYFMDMNHKVKHTVVF